MDKASGGEAGLGRVRELFFETLGWAKDRSSAHVFVPRFELPGLLRTVQSEHVTNVTLVSTMINMMLNLEQFDRFDLTSPKRVCFGAAPMSDGLLRQVLARLPNVRFKNCFNRLKRKENALGLSLRSSVGQESGWTEFRRKIK